MKKRERTTKKELEKKRKKKVEKGTKSLINKTNDIMIKPRYLQISKTTVRLREPIALRQGYS